MARGEGKTEQGEGRCAGQEDAVRWVDHWGGRHEMKKVGAGGATQAPAVSSTSLVGSGTTTLPTWRARIVIQAALMP